MKLKSFLKAHKTTFAFSFESNYRWLGPKEIHENETYGKIFKCLYLHYDKLNLVIRLKINSSQFT